MANCPFCGTRAATGFRRCKECGADLGDTLEHRNDANDPAGQGLDDTAADGPQGLEQRVVELLRRSQLISAIMLYREETGQGLHESKLAVEAIGRKHGITPKTAGCGTTVLLGAICTASGLWWILS